MAKKKSGPTEGPPSIPGLDTSPKGRKQIAEMYTALRRHFRKKKGVGKKKSPDT